MLERIALGDADILVGTRMFAKGHLFPRVTLIAIVDGDQGLFGAPTFGPGSAWPSTRPGRRPHRAGREPGSGRDPDPQSPITRRLAVLLREGY
ncbi:MAG: hypothetical protein ACT4QB_09365 [Gammaproteobacteria bacterium]